jgi:hypothetical protein
MQSITSALLITIACGAVATGPYFAFRDDFFARLIDRQTQGQINYEDQIADLRAQIDRMSRLDQERVEEIKSLRQRQATLEQVTSGLAKDLLIQAIQARNGLPASGAIDSAPVLTPIETHPQFRMSSPRSKLKKQLVVIRRCAARFESKRV